MATAATAAAAACRRVADPRRPPWYAPTAGLAPGDLLGLNFPQTALFVHKPTVDNGIVACAAAAAGIRVFPKTRSLGAHKHVVREQIYAARAQQIVLRIGLAPGHEKPVHPQFAPQNLAGFELLVLWGQQWLA